MYVSKLDSKSVDASEEQTTRKRAAPVKKKREREREKKNSQLTAMFLVAVVTAIVPVIAPRVLLDAALRGVTPELIQTAGRLHVTLASLLVPAVPAVQVTVALLLFGYAKLRGGSDASKVVRLALSVRCNTHIGFLPFLQSFIKKKKMLPRTN